MTTIFITYFSSKEWVSKVKPEEIIEKNFRKQQQAKKTNLTLNYFEKGLVEVLKSKHIRIYLGFFENQDTYLNIHITLIMISG